MTSAPTMFFGSMLGLAWVGRSWGRGVFGCCALGPAVRNRRGSELWMIERVVAFGA